MIGPSRKYARRQRSPIRRSVLILLPALLLVACCALAFWSHWLYGQIAHAAHTDQAAPADLICVFGAAEYNGRPSRVLRARLEHALDLYRRGMAPVILTLGGSAPGDLSSEGEVGASFLHANGVPMSAIIAETESRTTEESVQRVLAIARKNGFRTLLVVSDPEHVFRIQSIFAADGVHVLASPHEPIRDDGGLAPETREIAHEMLAYTLWRAQLTLSRWL